MAAPGKTLRNGKEFRAYDLGLNVDELIQQSVDEGWEDSELDDDDGWTDELVEEPADGENQSTGSATGMSRPTSRLGETEESGAEMSEGNGDTKRQRSSSDDDEGNGGKKRRISGGGDEGRSSGTGTAECKDDKTMSKKKRREKSSRKKRRARMKGVNKPLGYLKDQGQKSRGFLQKDSAVEMDSVDGLSLRHACGGFVGLTRIRKPSKDYWTVGEVQSLGFDYKAWDGIIPEALCDVDGRVIGVLAGRPSDPSYVRSTEKLSDLLRDARIKAGMGDGGEGHRRGKYCALSAGVSFGGGQQMPRNLGNTRKNAKILKSVMSDINILEVKASQENEGWESRQLSRKPGEDVNKGVEKFRGATDPMAEKWKG
ncbi:hypothetical protein BD779DRAFT_1483315 [Infundibulicybe gibba]|nr:hypothetical protein BD779DRAFT_1483315 [Infundibulicybe gibba]